MRLREDLTFNAWCQMASQTRRAYTCEGIGGVGCDHETVGHFYNDSHASANGWEVEGLPVCPECVTGWAYDMEASFDDYYA